MVLALSTIRNDLFFRIITTLSRQKNLDQDRDLFLAEPGDPNSHYSVYEDKHGTHIFSNNDLNMMTKLSELVEHGFDHWKPDGVYCPGENFVKITEYILSRPVI